MGKNLANYEFELIVLHVTQLAQTWWNQIQTKRTMRKHSWQFMQVISDPFNKSRLREKVLISRQNVVTKIASFLFGNLFNTAICSLYFRRPDWSVFQNQCSIQRKKCKNYNYFTYVHTCTDCQLYWHFIVLIMM